MLIGDFARLGQVSVRMLRHYDQMGLLSPTSVDQWTGYRSYSPEQLSVLNRIVALKDLGLSLEQVGHVVANRVSAEELRGMLRLCQAKVEEEMRVAGTRLAAVESRLRMIEREDDMSTDYVVKHIDGVRLAAYTDTLDPETMAQHIGPMFDQAVEALAAAHFTPSTPIATYREADGGMDVVVGFAHAGEAPAGMEIIEVSDGKAVCGVHLGSMDRIEESWQALHRWIVENGYEFAGPCRELYVRSESEDQADWVTELQQPVHAKK